MQKVFLDGELVDQEKLDPAKTIYVGAYRPPFDPVFNGLPVCPVCGGYSGSGGASPAQQKEHWDAGHFDVPHYKTIPKSEKCKFQAFATAWGEDQDETPVFSNLDELRKWCLTHPAKFNDPGLEGSPAWDQIRVV